jgi:hypothetical protein
LLSTGKSADWVPVSLCASTVGKRRRERYKKSFLKIVPCNYYPSLPKKEIPPLTNEPKRRITKDGTQMESSFLSFV